MSTNKKKRKRRWRAREKNLKITYLLHDVEKGNNVLWCCRGKRCSQK